jgi:parallel beta-helix repeat protein
MTEMPQQDSPAAFLCYDRHDDSDDSVTRFRDALIDAVKTVTKQPFDIFHDRSHIHWGQPWRERIREALNQAQFLIPILTPNFLESDECRNELEWFLEVEGRRGRGDLILPVYYYPIRQIDDANWRPQDSLLAELRARNRHDWTGLRSQPLRSRKCKTALQGLAQDLVRALEAPAQEPSVLTVDRSHGPYRSIMAAIRAAESGDLIEVAEGVYDEAVVIDRSVAIEGRGDRERIVVQRVNENVISFQTGKGRIANLTIRKLGEGEPRRGSAVHITDGRLLLENNDISSTGLSCVSVRGAARPVLRANHIHSGRQEGVHLGARAGGIIEENLIYRNGLAGIAVWSVADLTVRNNEIYEGGSEGIFINRDGHCAIHGNRIRDNRAVGIRIKAGAKAGCGGPWSSRSLEEYNTIHDNGPHGRVNIERDA